MFKYLAYRFGQFWVTRLTLQAAYKVAIFMSDLHYCFSFRDRKAVQNNLKIICPQAKDLEFLSRQVFRNFGKYLVEFFRMVSEIDDTFMKERVITKNLHVIDDVLQKGKGAILLTAHIGNWELGGVLLSHLGYPSVAIALPHKERPVNNLFNKQREDRGLTIVPTSAATRKCLGMLRKNKIVAVVADRAFGNNAVYLDFFGKKAYFPKGPAIFSVKTGAPIVPIFLVRNEKDQFELMAEEPIYPPTAENGRIEEEVLVSLMRSYITVIEEKIREFPEQWMMFRNFAVKERAPVSISPEGEKSLS